MRAENVANGWSVLLFLKGEKAQKRAKDKSLAPFDIKKEKTPRTLAIGGDACRAIFARFFHFFAIFGGVLSLIGLSILARFLYFYFIGQGNGHIQSLIIASILSVGLSCSLNKAI